MAIRTLSTLILAAAISIAVAQTSPYSGMEGRPIKALAAEEVDALLDGHGMGFAMAAELNSYPGPKHVLELAAELDLTDEQVARTRSAFDRMHADAVRLGRAVVEAERALDRSFAEGSITEESLRRAMVELGSLHGELRFAHLRAHLEMRQVLTRHQLHSYDRLRGYGEAGHPGHHGTP